MRIGKRYMTKEQMRKSDYYILKTSSPMDQDSGGDTSSSLLDLENNEFNFTSLKVQSNNAPNNT